MRDEKMKKITLKSILMFTMLMLLSSLVSASYTVDETFTGNVDFFVDVYECTTSSCDNINPYQSVGASTSNDVTYTGSALSSNPDWYVLYLYTEDNCYMPKTKNRYWYGNGYLDYGTSDLTFEKKEQAFCGANVLNVERNTSYVINAGETVEVTADIQSAWDLTGLPDFVPDALDEYYNSHVDIYFKVYNEDYSQILYQEHEFVLINFNEWYYPSYSWAPTQPGIYHFEITTNMDNDCKCDGSNTKGGEVSVMIEEPTYCGDEVVQQPNDDDLFEYCDYSAEGPGVQCLESCRMSSSWDDDQCSCCGDGVLNGEETCDPNDPQAPDNCRETGYVCTYCGDGIEQPGEDCDDGNNQDGDGCSATCEIEEEPVGCVSGMKRDMDHVGLEGWEIHAKKVGQPDSSSVNTTTGSDGWFRFDDLEVGRYEFWEVMQPGWEAFTPARFQAEVYEGNDCTLIAFKNKRTEPEEGCLSGYKKDSEGFGLAGWNITIEYDDNSSLTFSTTTDGSGYYYFDELKPGMWNVREIMQDGWEPAPGHNDDYQVNVQSGEICASQDFVNRQIRDGCLAGYKRDNVGFGLAAWNITIEYDDDSSMTFSTLTDGSGFYYFADLQPGTWNVREIMQDGWEPAPGHDDEYEVEVYGDDFCAAQTFVNKQTCEDECDYGDVMCRGEELWECDNYDDDICNEWGFKVDCEYYNETDSEFECVGDILTEYYNVTTGYCSEQLEKCVFDDNRIKVDEQDCYYRDESEEYYVCENDDSYKYKDVEIGFCNSDDLVCDDRTETEFIESNDCELAGCSYVEYCEDNNVYGTSDCNSGYCEISTGLCEVNETNTTILIDECGENSDDEYCDGENIVHVEENRECVEEDTNAFCTGSSSTVILENCGPDTCIEYTVMDPEVFEYVDDFEGCEENPKPYCAYEVPDHPDYCLSDNLLMQSYCEGNDHNYQEFNCNDLDGCFEFTYTECANCWNPYDGRCQGDLCELTGLEYRDYSCGSGICQYTVSEFVDVDNDMLDDRCDDCIDVDHDGACDDEDTCPGVYNPTQVDTDNDGYGNACDDDKDGDGYPANEDCDDWNDEVHPNAQEIKNNGRDDDCNPNTLDKGAYTPRQALYVNIIYDEMQIQPGKELDIIVSVTNNNIRTLDNLRIMTAISGFQEKYRGTIQELKPGNTATKSFTINLPEDFNDDFEELKISIGNDEYKRIIYRELRLE